MLAGLLIGTLLSFQIIPFFTTAPAQAEWPRAAVIEYDMDKGMYKFDGGGLRLLHALAQNQRQS